MELRTEVGRLKALFLGLVTVFWIAPLSHAVFPDFLVVRDLTGDIQDLLKRQVKDATGFEHLQSAFETQGAFLDYHILNGTDLLQTVSAQLGALLGRKVSALERSVDFAEEVAVNYRWNGSLTDVEYLSPKDVNISDGFEDSELFHQVVNFNYSTVHIPVEIYEGSIDIQNDMRWTSEFDTLWKENRELDPTLLWQYFGSQLGIMRNFPASQWRGQEPDLYDVRRRPWYTQGASSPKDMLILIDTSGSTQGQALTIMMQAVNSLIDTLGDNDFLSVAHFANEAKEVVPCFDTFVQATYWNKLVMREFIGDLKANEMANYHKAFEFAFEQFETFYANTSKEDGTGAFCNSMIMFFTDGGSEMPEEVFEKYNANQSIRIFTYAVGPTANPIEAVRWIACNNRGYFDRIPAMGAIRSKVQGLGMMTTVTLPVYNRSVEANNQTILGVMGSDVTVSDMEKFVPTRKIGTNGYMMAINSNGYIVFHPDLLAKYGWVPNPANVDLLDVEYTTSEKEEVRRAMIDAEVGETEMSTLIYLPEGKYVENETRIYHYMPILNSSFSLGLVLPKQAQVYSDGLKEPMDKDTGIKTLEDDGRSYIVLSKREYLDQVGSPDEGNPDVEDFIQYLRESPDKYEDNQIQQLFSDAQVTSDFIDEWEKVYDPSENGFEAFFVATEAGFTRVYPSNASTYLDIVSEPWDSVYFRRAYDTDNWMFAPQQISQKNQTEINDTVRDPLVMVYRSMTIKVKVGSETKNDTVGVVGGWLNQDTLREYLFRLYQCKQDHLYACYLLDDGGYIVVQNDRSEPGLTGKFFGATNVESSLMSRLIEKGIYLQNIQYDYQAACTNLSQIISAGTRFYIPTIFYDILTLNWWTTKLTWSILNFNIMSWLFYPVEDYSAHGQVAQSEQANVSCVKELAQYQLNVFDDATEQKLTYRCIRCTRDAATSRVKDTNLLFVIVNRGCECEQETVLSSPKQVPDPNFAGAETGECRIVQRYRKRPPCYDQDSNADTRPCSGADSAQPSLFTLVLLAFAVLFSVQRHSQF